MKILHYTLLIFLAHFSMTYAQSAQSLHLLEQIRQHIAEERINPLNHPFLAEDIPGFQQLTEVTAKLDAAEIAELIESAPNIQVQAVIVFATQKLSPRDYLNVVEKVVELGINKRISYEIVSSALYPQENLQALLIDSYQDRQVRRILEAAKVIYRDKPRFLEGIDMVLSGEVKKDIDRRRAAGFPASETPPPPIRLDQESSDAP